VHLLLACLQLLVNAKGSFTADSQAAARAALGGSVDEAQLRQALLAAAEAELASKPTSVADDERMLQVIGWQLGGWVACQRAGIPACGVLPNASILMPLSDADLVCYIPFPPTALQTAHLMAPRQQAAVLFRLEKKRLLAGAIAKSKRRLSKKQA
jgi:hypothetical protein